jgi:MFS family permease
MRKPAAVNSPRVTRGAFGVSGVLLTQFVSVTDGLIVGVALPTVSRDLAMSTVTSAWVVNTYAIVFAACLVLGGRLADLFDRGKVFLIGQVVALGGCAVCAVAPEPALLLAGRGLQALGAAVATPAAVSLLASRYPDEHRRGRAFGWLTAAGGAGWASAALFGGLVVGSLGWRWVFAGMGILVVASACLVSAGEWPRHAGQRQRLDLVSAVVLAGALALVAGGLSGLRSPLSAEKVLFTAGAAAVAVGGMMWLTWSRGRASDSVLPREVLFLPTVWRAAVLGMLLPVSFVIPQFAGPVLNERWFGLAPATSGLVFLPLAVMPVLVTAFVGRVRDRLGDRWCVAGGFGLCAAGFAWAPIEPGLWTSLMPAYVVIGFGVTAVYVGLAVVSVRQVGQARLGTASGIFQCSNQVGGVTILATSAALMAPAIGGAVDYGTASPDSALTAFRVAFFAGAALCALGAVVAGTTLTAKTGAPS